MLLNPDAPGPAMKIISDPKAPGFQYFVVDRSSTLFESHGGMADIASRRPMRADTALMAYSMSKTITAAAVLQLVGAGKVRLDDSIGHYLEEQPYGPAVTVRQLLSHTSGVPNPIPTRWVHPMAVHNTFDERAALDSVLRKHPHLARPPGTKYAYSNIGYWLLGRIVEEASGEAFTSYVETHLFRPLEIEPDELGYSIADPTNCASGYLERYSFMNLVKRLVIDRDMIGGYEGRWLRIRGHYVNGAAFGGLVGNAGGFGRFLQDQLQDHSRILSDAMRALFREPQQTARGRAIPMTLGWHIGSSRERPFLYKEGGGAGFHSMMRVYPAAGIASVLMVNATTCDVSALLDDMDTPFLRP